VKADAGGERTDRAGELGRAFLASVRYGDFRAESVSRLSDGKAEAKCYPDDDNVIPTLGILSPRFVASASD